MKNKEFNNVIKIIIVVLIVLFVSVIPLPLKTENIIWHEVQKVEDSNSYVYFVQIGGTWCSRLYTDVKHEGSVCEIHVKGALAYPSMFFGSKRLPADDFIEDSSQSIEQIYLVCSDDKILIYDISYGDEYSKDYYDDLINRE